ncbi:MAG: helix-turn-helix domain-containing protein [Lachnospiraceae bacterium]|nr:helix-turn-helix domain-containing protein [Lachnospiraceae bacterium]
MEFNEKLQELRKARSMTQEELAEALFVSRTAISKWESGRGYPSLDSLKEISKFFSVSIDDLICTEEIISAAEDEKKEFARKYISLICNMLDIFLALLLFLPVFGNGTENPSSVSLYAITGLSTWIKAVFAVLIGVTALNGICGAIISRLDKPVASRHRVSCGMVMSIACAAVFILARQPYAGIICLAILVAKGLLAGKWTSAAKNADHI